MIYFITDTHEDGKSLKLSKKHIKKTIKQLTLLNSSDTLIHLGDVEEGKPLISWHKIKEILDENKVKQYYITGNHDKTKIEDYHCSLTDYENNFQALHMPQINYKEYLIICGHLHPELPLYSAYYNLFVLPPSSLYSLKHIKKIIKSKKYKELRFIDGNWEY